MIGFVTSLRARALARDWSKHVWLLEQTVASMLAVDGANVAVVCHEIPDTPLTANPRVHFQSLDVPVPARNNDAMCVDKALKVSAGIDWMRDRGATYIGLCDADDLVSQALGPFVRARAGEPGWYTSVELIHAYGSRWMRRLTLAPHAAGPFAVIRADLLDSAVPPYRGDWVDTIKSAGDLDYLAMLERIGRPLNPFVAAGHMFYRPLLDGRGAPLAPFPFPPHLMINHDDSTSGVAGGSGSFLPPRLRAILRGVHHWLPTIRPVTSAVRSAFTMPVHVPSAYAGASLFLR